MGSSRSAITDILKKELRKKDQIKLALVINATYIKYEYKGIGDMADIKNYNTSYHYPYHRSNMHVLLSENDIDQHLIQSVGEIDEKIEAYMKEGSGKILLRLEMILIETYTLHRSNGGSYIPTPKKLANTKCTINPDNQELIDPETNTLSEKCLQGALGVYFAYQDGNTKHPERIFRAKKLKPYLDIVKLDGIPMPTPVCSHIFNKIEEMNPNISINVWEWKEKSATPKPVIASKNYNRQHIIDLMALTDITKSEEDKKCTQSFSTIKALDHHRKHCFSLGEATQEVKLPTKANFEVDNKKCNEEYGGQMRKLDEQKANSFCYLVYWIDTGDIWGPYLYRGENATQEFVRRIDKELVEINKVLAIKHDRIITEKDTKKFAKADICWICKEKLAIDDKVWDHCHITVAARN
ncbi:gastrula zinc finger protein xlcgf46.1 [Gigaspora margarita]|uniref:Gastrula zinc finger protein xlcgf46.1 n=1 Tax=Gigaspora margarita TaxID=4874 RepID=A0A8H4B4G2_GIGMA|nr:gastrula zinc finger protein xlcgf46.1 [Gigaspora margarita]